MRDGSDVLREAEGSLASAERVVPRAMPGGVTPQNGVVELTTADKSASPHAPSL
ncbi:hypothetical protein WMF31_22130 [Sorangium sp. So ce1036]|uniref:hypothetical protein n=1 Tax=Sorangium sp. So ce1036 TaxID=3133328 RepID=UPI003F02305F